MRLLLALVHISQRNEVDNDIRPDAIKNLIRLFCIAEIAVHAQAMATTMSDDIEARGSQCRREPMAEQPAGAGNQHPLH